MLPPAAQIIGVGGWPPGPPSSYAYEVLSILRRGFYTPIEDGSYYIVAPVHPCLSIRPSGNFSCPLHNSYTVQDIFMKLGTNINRHQIMCTEQTPKLHLLFCGMMSI